MNLAMDSVVLLCMIAFPQSFIEPEFLHHENSSSWYLQSRKLLLCHEFICCLDHLLQRRKSLLCHLSEHIVISWSKSSEPPQKRLPPISNSVQPEEAIGAPIGSVTHNKTLQDNCYIVRFKKAPLRRWQYQIWRSFDISWRCAVQLFAQCTTRLSTFRCVVIGYHFRILTWSKWFCVFAYL